MSAAPQLQPDIPPEWTPEPPVARPPLYPVPELPPEPIPEPPFVPGPALPVFAFLAVLLWPSETAPPWADELNPVTGLPYKNREEYEQLWKAGSDEVKRRVAQKQLEKARTARQNAAAQLESNPLACVQPCPLKPLPNSEPLTRGTIKLECDPTWDDCQKKQAREKVRRLNELAKAKNGLQRRRTAGTVRDLGNTWAAKYRSDFNRLANGQPKSRLGFTHPDATPPTGSQSDFIDPCLYQQWVQARKAGSDRPPLNECSPDHVQDLQWGGHVQGPLVWLDREVNEKLGRDMSAGENDDIDIATGFELKCP